MQRTRLMLGIGCALLFVIAVVLMWPIKEPSEHKKMVLRLSMIRESLENNSEMFGTADLDRATGSLEALDGGGTRDQRLVLNQTVGEAQIRLGNEVVAIQHLEAAFALIDGHDRIPLDVQRGARYDLAVAYLRLGESQNCIECANSESCIFPLRGEAVHGNPEGGKKAIEHLMIILAVEPENLKARWLLNIAYMALGQFPAGVPEKFLVPILGGGDLKQPRGYANVAKEMGISGDSLSGGAVIDDFDNDGDLDIITSSWHPAGQLTFYTNEGGVKFRDRTDQSGLTGILGGLNIIQADYDNDGDIDLLVLRGAWLGPKGNHPNSLLQNDGKGMFTDVTISAGLGKVDFPTQTAAWADYDNDGDLDLFVGNEGYRNQLFANNGDGTFVDRAHAAGVADSTGFCKAVVWGDFDGDRFPDIYVSNFGVPDASSSFSGNRFATSKGMPNRLYRNNRDGTFTDVAEKLGVAQPHQSFASWFWDYNNDGTLDLFVSTYNGSLEDFVGDYLGQSHKAELCRLYEGDGQGGFRDVTAKSGLGRLSMTMGANFGDLDNDGFLDFYLGTGAPGYDFLTPNVMYRNNAGHFEDITTKGGFGHLQKGHGISFADLNDDGNQEVFVQLGGAFPGDVAPNALFQRQTSSNGHWLKINCRGQTSNRYGIGARIRLTFTEAGKQRSVYRWVGSGGTFGANPLQQHLGVGQATTIDEVEVYWPTSDQTQRFANVPVGGTITIHEGQTELRRHSRRDTQAAISREQLNPGD